MMPSRRPAWLPDAIALVAVCLVMLVGYYEIPFEGKTFSASSAVAGVQGCDGATQLPFVVCRSGGPEYPRRDLGASSWALEPWAQVTHQQLADGNVPLWNPYQGLGTPLAANMQSAVFDPLLLALHVHPTPLVQDLSFLLGLLLVGFGTYAAARSIRLSPVAATVAGCVYGLSGWFFIYSNNQWFRVYLYLPVVVACLEWTLRSTRRLPIALLALSIAGAVLVGMPEPTFIIFVVVGLYAVVRLFDGPRAEPLRRTGALRLAIGAAIGIGLTAPLLMVFREYVPLSFNAHSNLGDEPPLTDPISASLNWLMPKITPEGIWTHVATRNWVGVGAVVLAVVAVTSARARWRYVVWPFLAIGSLMAIQIYGGRLVSWTRHVPLWSQVIWTTFGTPVIAFSIALLAAVGVQTLLDGALDRRHLLIGLGMLASFVLLSVVRSTRVLAFTNRVDLLGGWPLAVVAAVAMLVVIFFVPTPLAGVLAAGIVVLEIVLLAPHGFYFERKDPYPSYGWLDVVSRRTAEDSSRVFSSDGLLFPDIAGVYKVSDPRTLDALYPDRYWRYVRAFIAEPTIDRFSATVRYETDPHIAANPMFDLLGARYLLYNTLSGDAPPSDDAQFRLVYEDDPVLVYENTHVAPRAFVVHDVKRVDNTDAAVQFFSSGDASVYKDGTVKVAVDPTRRAVIEAPPGSSQPSEVCDETPPDTARIVSRTPNSVKIDVTSSCAGLLVLSDQYYPGWSATVNGHDTHIYPTDVAMRGVFVPSGHSTVEFRYQPESFRAGVLIAVLALAALLVVLLAPAVSGRRGRARERA